MQTKHYVALALVAGLIIGIGGWLLLAPKAAVAPTTSTTATTTNTGGVQVTGTGTSTITEVDTTSNPTAPKPPALRPINYSAGTSADVQTALNEQYATLAPQLQAAPTRVDLWLELGTAYKIGGDYPGAIAAWNYVASVGPVSINYVAYGNLGDLYLNFIHDYAKAEVNYQAALKGAPDNLDYQAGLKQSEQLLGQ